MQSEGEISTKDIRRAYRYFDLDAESSSLDDDTIIGVFQSRLSDAPKQEADARQALQIIGYTRGSERIQHLASKSKSRGKSIPVVRRPYLDNTSKKRNLLSLLLPLSSYDCRTSSRVVEC